ncbi:ornithine cyclodeaminase [Streptomyces sp. CoH27]|uniref:ornithine cyclodeaminase n=1 Tax=Streptomyces sp. CoH27 TaxID=2875763 RepID=UPI001CD72826|nr:ornithine cyclodeaminase [Streptomyces sp. CoH27]
MIRAAGTLDPVEEVRAALMLHATEATTLPEEAYLPWTTEPGAFARSLALPGAVWGDRAAIGLKVINSSLSNPDRGLPRAQGLTMLFDQETARPTALMEAGYLSALRTSAYTMLSIQALGRKEPQKVTIIGCGTLGESHARLIAPGLPEAWFVLYDEVPARLRAMLGTLDGAGIRCRPADSAKQAVAEADVVVTATTTTDSYLPFDWLSPGALIAHVSLDGVEPDVVRHAGLVVVDDWPLVRNDDRRLLGRMYRAGTLLSPDGEGFGTPQDTARRVDGTPADVLAGRRPGRTDEDQIILSNPFGMGILDVALAARIAAIARQDGLGVTLPA